MKKSHRNDKNHGKNGFITGNARYNRKKPGKSMGRARMSASFK